MKKFVAIAATVLCLMFVFSGCGNTGGGTDEAGNDTISVISREDGSGTRGAFIELFGIEEKDAEGNKVDKTVKTSEETNSTGVMLTTVAGNKNAIGYVSLGSLDNTVKAVKIDGAEATVDNVKNGTYKVSRPFNIAVKEGLSEVAQDFVDYILSTEGQEVVQKNGYIPLEDTKAYTSKNLSGKITLARSSSVTPVMEKLKEAYIALNSGVTIEIQQNDSTSGMNAAIDGICDIGMASRELKESETAAGLTGIVIATDGIAVIVNKDNAAAEDLTSEQVKKIYTGEITSWSALNA